MIISFSVENWMSFRDEVTLSIVASRERQHGDRITKLKKYQTRVLPIAAIFGGNASGKSNLFRALAFTKHLIVEGTQPDSLIPVDAFRLGENSSIHGTRFIFELLIGNTIYEFSFSVTRRAILEEKLVKITSTNETVLYHRRDGQPNFDGSLPELNYLKFVFRGTRDNQLMLTNSIHQNVNIFKPVYDWFGKSLQLVSPSSRFAQFELFLDKGNSLYSNMNEILPQLDTGITRLGSVEIPFYDLPIGDDEKADVQESIKEGNFLRLTSKFTGERFVVTREGDKLKARKLAAYHQREDGTEIKFEMHQESDGTKRIIDLLPAFIDLTAVNSNKVYAIDEIDRSLHTQLTRGLLESYLTNCSIDSRSQLLFTTHDVQLMDQELLRRDEMWVTERDYSGSSQLLSFSEYKDIRYDKDIRKSYLQGRLGGIPSISF